MRVTRTEMTDARRRLEQHLEDAKRWAGRIHDGTRSMRRRGDMVKVWDLLHEAEKVVNPKPWRRR